MKAFLANDNVVIDLTETFVELEDGGLKTDTVIYYNYDVLSFVDVTHTIPDDYVPAKYCYSDVDGFYLNENYLEEPIAS